MKRQIQKQNVNAKVGKDILGTKWYAIDWAKAQKEVIALQIELVKAAEKNDLKEMHRIQQKIISSFAARAIAVRKVTSNRGGKTAGVDKVVWAGGADYWEGILKLDKIVRNPDQYRAKPLRRVLIPKNKTEMRSLGIPTIMDRAVQALYHMAIDPIVETQSDANSFGFRKGRSTQHAVLEIREYLNKPWSPEFVLEADISKCFDKISHKFLIANTIICHKNVLIQWLKSGVMVSGKFNETEGGTPQGGVISPTLCNIALNGMEAEVKKEYYYEGGKGQAKQNKCHVKLIRYADDVICTAQSVEILEEIQRKLSKFLEPRGLELNEQKTKITNVKDGFTFLGFDIKKVKYDPQRNPGASSREYIITVVPSKKGRIKIKAKIAEIIIKNRKLIDIIGLINPVLRGWAEHKRVFPNIQFAMKEIDNYVWERMRSIFLRRTKNQSSLKARYNKITKRNSIGVWGVGNSLILQLARVTTKLIKRIRLDMNPYTEEGREYFINRKQEVLQSEFKSKLWKKYKGICSVCQEPLNNGETIELHHIKPVKDGGKTTLRNMMPVHWTCHRQITHGKK